MNIRIGKAISLFALCLVVPMGIARAQAKGVTCTDGTTSASVGKGACSGHGGVKAKAATKTTATQAGKTKTTTTTKTKTSTKMEGGETKAAKPAPKTTAKPDAKVASKPAAPAAKPAALASAADKDSKNATASCKDGTYSHAATHTGACSGHGGVLKFLKP